MSFVALSGSTAPNAVSAAPGGAAMTAMYALTENMAAALLKMGNQAVTTAELGVNSSVMNKLAASGLIEADRDGYPIIYRINSFGAQVVELLCIEPELRDHEQPIARIQRIVAETFRIPVIEMVSERRARRVARPRQIAMYLARETTTKSLPDIGRRFGGRDHTTVIHACNVVEGLTQIDPQFKATVDKLIAKLCGDDEMSDEEREQDAIRGSSLLRDAILTVHPQTCRPNGGVNSFSDESLAGKIAA